MKNNNKKICNLTILKFQKKLKTTIKLFIYLINYLTNHLFLKNHSTKKILNC